MTQVNTLTQAFRAMTQVIILNGALILNPKGGKAGTVYLCHPFLVHSAQLHRGSIPKFMAQPPLLLKGELSISDADVGYSPVEQAIRKASD